MQVKGYLLHHVLYSSLKDQRGIAMYSLIILFAILSPATGAVIPVGVTSQVVAKFKTLDQCKEAANKQGTGGAISDLNLSRGIYWYCAYVGPR